MKLGKKERLGQNIIRIAIENKKQKVGIIVAEEKQAMTGVLSRTEASEAEYGDRKVTSIYAVLAQSSMFGVSDEFKVKLTESEGDGFDKERLGRAFDKIAENIKEHKGEDVELEVPEEITEESVAEVLKPYHGEDIDFYESYATYDIKGDDGKETGEQRVTIYFSLHESTSGFRYANSSVADLIDHRPELLDKKEFWGLPTGFLEDKWDSVPVGGNRFENAEYIEGTETLKGLANFLFSVLKSDGSDFANKLMNDLKRYMEANKDKETFTGIIQTVGVFSERSRDAKKFKDEFTITRLEKALSKTSTKHAHVASIRALFNAEGVPSDLVFKSKPLDDTKYKKASGKNEPWTILYNPKDVSWRDFYNFISPLERRGYLKQEDANELIELTDGIDITRKLIDIIERENLGFYLQVANLSDSGALQNTSTIELIDIRPLPDHLVGGDQSVEETSEKPVAETSTDTTSTQTEEETTDNADDVFADAGLDDLSTITDDDDLPF